MTRWLADREFEIKRAVENTALVILGCAGFLSLLVLLALAEEAIR